MLVYHIAAFSIGTVLDWIVGDPYWMPHPIRLIGRLIGFLDKLFMGDKKDSVSEKGRSDSKEYFKGVITALIVMIVTVLITFLIIYFGYRVNSYLGLALESILTCYILAARSLDKESMKVFYPLKEGKLEEARFAVSMIVGRDTAELDEIGVTKAAVETVAENTSDGVIAPMIYTAIGGPVLGLLYKSINTMDSMIGYKNDRYMYFGRFAAKLDDVVNFIPSRISALLMVTAAYIGGDYDGKAAWRIFKRDRFNSKSPNSAQTESVCAGALGIKLLGPASYFGKIVEKPTIGDANREIMIDDIKLANKLMFMTEGLLFVICLIIMMLRAFM